MSIFIKSSYKDIQIYKFAHDTILFKNKVTIIFDPYQIEESDLIPIGFIDAIFITHSHFDHYSPDDISKILLDNTMLIYPEVMDKLVKSKFLGHNPSYFLPVKPLNKYSVNLNSKTLRFMTLPAYNINKLNDKGQPYHPKSAKFVSYFINLDGVSIFFAGDSDNIPEFKALKNIVDVACIPISGTYVMDQKEAIDFVKGVSPKVVVPMHYGSIIGDKDMGKTWAQKIKKDNIQVEVVA